MLPSRWLAMLSATGPPRNCALTARMLTPLSLKSSRPLTCDTGGQSASMLTWFPIN